MKVKITTEIDIPDVCRTMDVMELHQLIFDEVLQSAVCHHLHMALTMETTRSYNTGSVVDKIVGHHQLWADVLSDAPFQLEVVDKK